MVASQKPAEGTTVSPCWETSPSSHLHQKYSGKKKGILFSFSLFFQYLSVCITELSTQGMYNLSRTQYVQFCLQLHSVKPGFAPS